MILRFTTRFSFLLFFSLSLINAKAQTSIAQQTSYNPGWYSTLANYTDTEEPAFSQYMQQGQTFKSLLTTSITTVEFFVEGFNLPGDVHVEIYSCPAQNTWGSLLGTKTNVSITGNGWVSADLSTLNIQVIAGNYYGFKLIPQDGLQAGIGIKGSSTYVDGDAWESDDVAYENFYSGDDAPFNISGAAILSADFTFFNAYKQGEKAMLTWTTAAAAYSNNFTIEHRTNNGNWKTIGTEPASPLSNSSYTYTHNNPVRGSNYYRIGEVDHSGKYSYSEVRELYFGDNTKSFELVGSNPVITGTLQLKVYSATGLSFYNAEGKLLWKTELAAGLHNIDLGVYPKGIYFLRSDNRTEKVLVR